MKPIMVDIESLEPGAEPELITSRSRNVGDLPCAVFPDDPDGKTVSRWTFTMEERVAVANGADLYVFVKTHRQPFQPLSLVVGPER